MFLGEHQHALDAKGRVILPAKFRDQLANGAFITSEVDGCLAVWPPAEFEVKAREIQDKSKSGPKGRQLSRAFFSGTAEASPDAQGRVAIPEGLREFAGLVRDVVITGQFDHVEIWDVRRWQEEKERGNRGLAEGLEA